MTRRGVGRRFASVAGIAVLACLSAPPALQADEGASAPPDGAEAGAPEAPPAAPQSPDSGDDGTAATAGDAGFVAKRGGVAIGDNFYSPATLSISVGQTVSWTNGGEDDHTVTADDSSYDSGTLSPGSGFSHTFTAPGTFTYHCELHDEMSGTILVSGGDSGGGSGGPGSGGPGTSTGSGGTGSGGSTSSAPATGPLSESAAAESDGPGGGLPATGQLALPLALAAAALLAAGGLARRAGARYRERPRTSR